MAGGDQLAGADAIVIGSGFGGVGAAYGLLAQGRSVLMLERGDWVHRGPENWEPSQVGMLTPHYSAETAIEAHTDRGKSQQGGYYLVGGPSVFYGGVSLRFREKDFHPAEEFTGASRAQWPLEYRDLEPWYGLAERLLGVAGQSGDDPTEPPRSSPYPAQPGKLAQISGKLARAAESLGLHPFRLPLAINHGEDPGRACIACTTCDGYACAISAKNDLATVMIPGLIDRGMQLRPNSVVTRLIRKGDKIVAVAGVDRVSGQPFQLSADLIVLAAGSLASPQLVLGSGLEQVNPAGEMVGRFLQRHKNGIVFGLFPAPPDPVGEFHKQLGIHDYYFGNPQGSGPPGKLGGLQQLVTPPIGLVRANVPWFIGAIAGPLVGRLTGLLVITEDQPQFENRIVIDSQRSTRFGLPQTVVQHRYSHRDRAADKELRRLARRILRRAGALAFYNHEIDTFSHAVGTLRMGEDPTLAPLDPQCRFRGVTNLWVTDGSFMPTSAAVNPSLTIFANALRVAHSIGGDS